jgi:hypothetical protein
MKYYNKDYSNYINDDDTQRAIDKDVDEIRQIDEEYKKIEKSRSIFKSLLDVYRERHDGYPSNSIFLASFILTMFSLFVIMSLTTNVVIGLNLFPGRAEVNFFMYEAALMFLYMLIMPLIILRLIRPLFQPN